MKKTIILCSILITILLFVGCYAITFQSVKFLGFLQKGEIVEMQFYRGLITKRFSYENLKSKEDEDVKHFYQMNKIPFLFSKNKVRLIFYKNENIIYDSLYVYDKKNPTYLIGVMLPKFYDEMLTKGDDVSYYKFYFKTKQDDIDLENEIRKIQEREKLKNNK